MISLIVAMSENRGIGFQNRIPWRLSADLRRFKRLTMGHHLIVGRKTYESIGQLLPGRKIIVLTSKAEKQFEGVETAASLGEAIDLARSRGDNEIFIGGGAQVYEEGLPQAERIYLTVVHAKPEADVYFPDVDFSSWFEVSGMFVDQDEHNQYSTTYKVLDAPQGK
jgi:dihydrofolate reductase